MYWVSYLVIAIILIGLVLAYRMDIFLTQILLIQNLVIYMFVNIVSIRYPWIFYGVLEDLAGRAVYLQTGEKLYTFLTLMYLHGSFMHVVGNMLILFFIGVALEQRIGKKWTAAVYFPAGVLATMGQYVVVWGSDILNLGASGAVMGLMGAIVLLYPKDKIPMFLGPILMPEVRVDIAVAVFVMMQTGIAFIRPSGNVAHAAHFAGFGAGMLLAVIIKRKGIGAEGRVTKDFSKLKRLVYDEETEGMYRKIVEADSDVVRDAWVEHLVENSRCPECGRELNSEDCECGFNVWED